MLEWDEQKRRSNLKKHKIDFAELQAFFGGDLLEVEDGRRDYCERRLKAIGELNGVLLSVVYTWRHGRRRLISARRARLDERRRYEAKIEARSGS